MSRPAEAYRDALISLLPTGDAWPHDPATTMGGLLYGLAGEMARLDARADDLLAESYPGAAAELLGDWERVLGLPDACSGPVGSADQRHRQLLGRLAQIGGQAPGYFVGIAAVLGWTIAIEEFTSCDEGCDCTAELFDDRWRFAWMAHVAAHGVGDLRCVLGRIAPAHTILAITGA